jgi:hypothetical protein
MLKPQGTQIKLLSLLEAVKINFQNSDLIQLMLKCTDTTSKVKEISSRFTSRELLEPRSIGLTKLILPHQQLELEITLLLRVK